MANRSLVELDGSRYYVAGLLLTILASASLNYAPDVLTHIWPQLSEKALDYVSQGLLTTLLWLALGVVCGIRVNNSRLRFLRTPVLAVIFYGALSAYLRVACRLAFPMTHSPTVPKGMSLCEAAGYVVDWPTVYLIFLVVWLADLYVFVKSSN